MRKVLPIVLATALTGGVVFTTISFINDQSQEQPEKIVTGSGGELQKSKAPEKEVVTDEEELDVEPMPSFLTHTGVVGKVEKLDTGYFKIELGEGDNIVHLVWNPTDTKIVDNQGNATTLEEGMSFTAYTSANKPMIMIYPPQYTPDVIVVQTDAMGMVEWTKFNADYLNAAGNLKLNLDKSVVIENVAGDTLKVDAIVDKDVLVFYGKTTRSIPAQTTPIKIIVLDQQ